MKRMVVNQSLDDIFDKCEFCGGYKIPTTLILIFRINKCNCSIQNEIDELIEEMKEVFMKRVDENGFN